jgi:hypothetical protein
MEVVLLIAGYNGSRCLGECLRSVLDSDEPGIELRIIVVDNASTDGTADLVAGQFPQVDLIRLNANLGFTGGINAGWRYARGKFPDAQYVGILNQDILTRSGWLTALITHLQRHPRAAAVQPKVLLWPEIDLYNTAGNQSHYLGFGLVTGYGQHHLDCFGAPRGIDFPSGAATLIRRDVLGNYDLLEDIFFLYLEDAELGWKLRQLGFRIDYVPSSAVWHKYSFHRDYRFYFYLERNRWYLLAMYYKTPTLLLLLPALLMMEIGQFYFAWRNHVLDKKIKACTFFLSASNQFELRKRRKVAQARRRISDRKFLRHVVAEIDLPELRSRLLRNVGNPMLRAYWMLVRPLIFW